MFGMHWDDENEDYFEKSKNNWDGPIGGGLKSLREDDSYLDKCNKDKAISLLGNLISKLEYSTNKMTFVGTSGITVNELIQKLRKIHNTIR